MRYELHKSYRNKGVASDPPEKVVHIFDDGDVVVAYDTPAGHHVRVRRPSTVQYKEEVKAA